MHYECNETRKSESGFNCRQWLGIRENNRGKWDTQKTKSRDYENVQVSVKSGRSKSAMKGYHYIKRGIDIILSGMAIVILSPLLLFLCIAIKLDTPGPILFKQKRVGIHRSFFQIYKFRTMRIDTPKDVPTHMLENPEQYITKVGKFLYFCPSA